MRGAELREWIRTMDGNAFDGVMDSPDPRGDVEDMYSRLAPHRAAGPVQPVGLHELLDVAESRTSTFTERQIFCCLDHDTVREALSDGERFSSQPRKETIAKVWGHTILSMDGQEHRLNRALVAQAFTPRHIEAWRTELIEPIVQGLLDRIEDRDRVDLMTEFFLPFPMHVVVALLELPPEDVPTFLRWAQETITILNDPAKGLAASQSLHDYLDPIVEQRRGTGGADLISQLADATLEGEQLSNLAVVSFLRLLLAAGGETTFRSSSSTMFMLLQQPDQLAATIKDPQLIPAAIEEGLRLEPPLPSIQRLSMYDTEIAGVAIPANSIVEAVIGAANRDPGRWSDPDMFDLHRPLQSHVTFAFGPHVCLGAHLARLEMISALTALFDRFGGCQLAEEVDAPARMSGMGFRSPTHLDVVRA